MYIRLENDIYVLGNPDGKKYIGQTANLERRIKQHNDPENKRGF